MIDEHLIPNLHRPQVLERQVVLHPVPHGGLLAGEVVEAVGGRLGLDDPVAWHDDPLVDPGAWPPGLAYPHRSFVAHRSTVAASSVMTSASVLPDRLSI